MTAPSRESVEALRRGLVAGVAEMHAEDRDAFVALCDAYIATYSQPAPGVSAKEAAREWLAKNIVGYRERIRACQDLGAMPPEQIASLAALIERREREVAREAGEEERCQRCSNIVEPGELWECEDCGGMCCLLCMVEGVCRTCDQRREPMVTAAEIEKATKSLTERLAEIVRLGRELRAAQRAKEWTDDEYQAKLAAEFAFDRALAPEPGRDEGGACACRRRRRSIRHRGWQRLDS